MHLFAICSIFLTLVSIINSSEVFYGPSTPDEFYQWYSNLSEWKEAKLAEINFNGSIFEVPELKWTQTTFMQPQIHPFDQYFYNITTHSYTPDKFIMI